MTTTINASNSGSGGLVQTADASGVLALQTAGTTAVTVDASQNVGIGIASPNGRLQVTAAAGSQTGVYLGNQTAGARTDLHVWSASNADGYIFFERSGASENGYIRYSQASDFMSFQTASAERMRIDSSGNVLVGTTSQLSGEKLGVLSSAANQMVYFRNSNASPGGIFVNYSVATPNNTGSEFLFCNDPAQTRMTVRSNGGIANYSGNNVNLSDRREKINFAPAKPYLDVICAIPVQTFNYIDQNMEEDPGLTLGVAAQDVQAVAPELVSESDWSTEKDGSKMRLSIYQTDLQYALMKCIQEQQALITSLTARIAALEGTPA